MYAGKNPSALQSQEWITGALLALMREKDFSSISVREICERADLSRQTYYNLYSSKEDILRTHIRRQVRRVLNGLEEPMRLRAIGLGDMTAAFTEVIFTNRDDLSLMAQHGLEPLISSEITEAVAATAQRFPQKDTAEGALEKEYAIAFLSGGLAQALLLWLRGGEPADRDTLNRILGKAVQGALYSF